MRTDKYPETVSTSPAASPPTPKFGWRWFAAIALVGGASSLVWREVHDSGSVVLIAATWAALLVVGTVSCVRFTRRHRHREAQDAALR